MARVINVSDEAYKGGGYKPMPDGNYIATVYEIQESVVRTGENAGKDQLDVTYKVQEPAEHAGKEIRFQKLPLYDGKGAWKLVTFLDALGLPSKPPTIPDNIQELVGQRIGIRVGTRADQNGVDRNQVSGFAAADETKTSVASVPTGERPTWNSLSK